MRKAIVIGLTGQTGAGKSTVAKLLESKGCAIVSADEKAREVVLPGSPILPELQTAFGEDVIREDGTLNRALLAERAFAGEATKKKLNDIMHPAIVGLMEEAKENFISLGETVVVMDASQLFEAHMESIVDAVVSVVAPEDERAGRICKRDLISDSAARLRMNAQFSEAFFREHSDFVVENDGDRKHLEKEVDKLFKFINTLKKD